MKALLLAAGLGTRLRPITDATPKCLVKVHDKPLLDFWFDLLFPAGIERALVNMHWLAKQVETHIAGSRWRDRIDTAYEPELLGTGGTIVANRSYFASEDFLLAHVDNLTDFDVVEFIEAHRNRPRGCIMTMLTFQTDDPRSCGILALDKYGVVQEFHEKVENPPGDLANAAVYIVGREIVDFTKNLGKPFVDLSTEVIPHFVGRIFTAKTRGYHRDIGTLKSLQAADVYFRSYANGTFSRR